ncbi:MAG: ATP-binding cassette domain-containing protein [Pirellulales bacterium]
MLQLTNVRKAFREPDGSPLPILDLERFAVAAGEQMVLVGPSGSGKTTLLHIIAGILKADEGVVQIAGTDISRLSEPARDRFRAQHLGYVFQTFNLLPGFRRSKTWCWACRFPIARPTRAARRLLERWGWDRLSHRPAALSVGSSSGWRSHRALANKPKLVLADEPTASVDAKHQQQVIDLLRKPAAKIRCRSCSSRTRPTSLGSSNAWSGSINSIAC